MECIKTLMQQVADVFHFSVLTYCYAFPWLELSNIFLLCLFFLLIFMKIASCLGCDRSSICPFIHPSSCFSILTLFLRPFLLLPTKHTKAFPWPKSTNVVFMRFCEFSQNRLCSWPVSSVNRLIHPSVCPFIYLSIRPSIRSSICPSVPPSSGSSACFFCSLAEPIFF